MYSVTASLNIHTINHKSNYKLKYVQDSMYLYMYIHVIDVHVIQNTHRTYVSLLARVKLTMSFTEKNSMENLQC